MITQLNPQLQKLVALLTYVEEGAFAIALYDHPDLRDKMIAELHESLSQHVHNLALNKRSRNPIELIQNLQPEQGDVICLYNLEPAFPEALSFLDLQREVLTDMRVSVVCWVTAYEHGELAHRAPNFYAFRSAVFDFTSAPVPRPQELTIEETKLIGREPELQKLRDGLSKGGSIMLVGVGGVGKTALAQAVVAEMRSHFTGGTAWVDCYSTAWDLSDVFREVALALGGDTARQTYLTLEKSQQKSHLQHLMHRRPCLIVLDGLENSRAKTELTDWLQAVLPPSAALLISRERFPGFDLPTIELHGLSGEDAVRLFMQRAQKAGWKENNVDLIPLLCKQVDNHPLGVELLAAAAAAVPLPELYQRLMRASAESDKSTNALRASIDFAFKHLTEPSQKLWKSLSILPDGLSESLIEPFTHFVEIGDGNKAVAECVQHGLIESNGQRYHLHPLVRQFALEQIGESTPQYQEQSVHFYRELLADLSKDRDEERMRLLFTMLDAEWHNAVDAVDVAYRLGDWETVVFLVDRLRDYLRWRGMEEESLRLSHLGLAAADRSSNRQWQASALFDLGITHARSGQWLKAEEAFQQSLHNLREAGDMRGEAVVLYHLANIHAEQARWQEAEKLLELVIDRASKLNDEMLRIRSLDKLSDIFAHQHRWSEAESALRQVLEIEEALSTLSEVAHTWSKLGDLYVEQERWAEAEKAYQRSLRNSLSLRDYRSELEALEGLLSVYAARDRWAEIERTLHRMMEISREIGDVSQEARVRYYLSTLYARRGDMKTALREAEEAKHMLQASDAESAPEMIRVIEKLIEFLSQNEA